MIALTMFLYFVYINSLLIVYFTLKSLLLNYSLRNVPGPLPRLPLIGNVWYLVPINSTYTNYLANLFDDIYNQFKANGMAVITFGSRSVVFLFDHQTCNRLLKMKSLYNKPSEYNFAKCFVRNGLITSNGSYWKNSRKLLNPSFHVEILNSYIPTMNEEGFELIKKLKKFSKLDFLNIKPVMYETTMNIITKTALGVSLKDEQLSVKKYVSLIDAVISVGLAKEFNPLKRFDYIFYRTKEGKKFKENINILHKFSYDVLQKRKAIFNVNKEIETKRNSFLDLLLKLQHEDASFTDTMIQEQVDTLMIAGSDTSAMCLTYTIFLLGLHKHKNYQQKVKEEMHSIFGEDVEREVTVGDINRMRYTECVLKESMRLYSPIPLIGRKLSEETVINGHNFPEGTSVIFMIQHAHHDEKVYLNANQFIPERFEDNENAFVFATGPRNCIGQRFAMIEMKIIMAHIFRRFTVESLSSESDLELSYAGVLTTIGQVKIRLFIDSK